MFLTDKIPRKFNFLQFHRFFRVSRMSWYIQEQEPVYVDNNATTQIDDRVQQRIVDAAKNLWANPSSVYEIGWF